MVYSYYPGCTLKNKATDLDRYARLSAEALGFTLEEIPEWQCCGGVYPMAKNETAHKLSSVRALVYARDENKPLVTLCSACFNVIKQVNGDMKNDESIRTKANNYLKLDTPYAGEAEVLHYLQVLRDKVGFDKLGVPNAEIAVNTYSKQNIRYEAASDVKDQIGEFLNLFNIELPEGLIK